MQRKNTAFPKPKQIKKYQEIKAQSIFKSTVTTTLQETTVSSFLSSS